MEYQCKICHEQPANTCQICPHCLFRSLLKDHLYEILDNSSIQLTTDNQNFNLSLIQIKDTLNDIDLGSHQRIPMPKLCNLHHLVMDTYCMNCKIILCATCIAGDHTTHDYHTNKQLEEHIRSIPSVECLKIVEAEQNFIEEFTKFLFPSLQYFDKLIQTIEKRKTEFIQKMRKIFERVELVLEIIKILYNKFYLDLKENLHSIEDLVFYNQVKLLTPTVQMRMNEIATNLLDKEIIKPEVKISFNEVKFEDFTCIQTLRGHTKSVATLLQLKDGLLASGSRDGTIKIWEIHKENYSCIETITRHTHWVTALIQLSDGRMASGSWDDTIKIWKIGENSLSCTHTLTGHTSSVFSLLQLSTGQIASGSRDNTIKIWDINDKSSSCKQTLTGHVSLISSLIQLNDGLMASGSRDCTIKIWDMRRCFKCIQTLTGHMKAVSSLLQLRDGRMASGSWDTMIKIWERREGSIRATHTLAGQIAWVVCLIQMKDGRIASGSSDYTIRIWEITEKNVVCIYTLFGHADTVNSLIQLKDGRLASGSSDSTIKIWEEEPLSKRANEHSKRCLIY